MAISGTFYGATSNAWVKPRITWTAQADIEGNYSDVTATLSYTRTNSGFTTYGHWGGTITIDGNQKSVGSTYVQITNGGYTATITHTARVPHNDDGTRAIRVSATGSIPGTSLSYTSISADVTLEAIPRAASIAANDGHIGSVSMVTIGKRSDLYTHTVAYRFGNLSGYLAEDGLSDEPVRLTGTAVPFHLPESFYYQIPDAPTGVCTLTCTTYREDAQVGTAQQTTFTVRADPALCAPVLTAGAVDTEPVTLALTGDENKAVRYASRLLCTMTCEGLYGAQITEKKIAGVTVTDDQLVLEAAETGTVRFSVRDSRGYVTEQVLELELIPYSFPTGLLTAGRTDATSGDAELQVRGSWFCGSLGLQENLLQARCRVGEGPWQDLQVQTEENDYTVTGNLSGLLYTDAHRITLEISDRIGTLTLSAQINPGIPVFEWGKSDFCFHVPVTAPKVTDLDPPEADADAVNKAYADTKLSLSGGTMTGTLDMGACSLTGLGQPSAGTDAATKDYADTKLSMALVWENASPGSAFAAQTISLDLSPYDAVLIYFKTHNATGIYMDYETSVIAQIGYKHTALDHSEEGSYFATRAFSVTAANIVFNGAAYARTYASSSMTSSYGGLVPQRIYGIKGVIG